MWFYHEKLRNSNIFVNNNSLVLVFLLTAWFQCLWLLLSGDLNRIFLQRWTLDESKYCDNTKFATVVRIYLIIFFKKRYRENSTRRSLFKTTNVNDSKIYFEETVGARLQKKFELIAIITCVPPKCATSSQDVLLVCLKSHWSIWELYFQNVLNKIKNCLCTHCCH